MNSNWKCLIENYHIMKYINLLKQYAPLIIQEILCTMGGHKYLRETYFVKPKIMFKGLKYTLCVT